LVWGADKDLFDWSNGDRVGVKLEGVVRDALFQEDPRLMDRNGIRVSCWSSW